MMKNSLNEIKINLSSNAYMPNEQLKDFIYNNYVTCSNQTYNTNGIYHIEKYPSSFVLNANNNQIGKKNYRDLLNMSLQNKKIVVNKMGFIKKKDDKNIINNEKTYNSTINEKIIDFNKSEKIKKKPQIKSIEKDRNIIYINFPTQNITQRNKFNLTLDIDKNNNKNEMFNKCSNTNYSNKAISYQKAKNKNISYEKKISKTCINRHYNIKEHNSISFEEKIFKNVFNKFIKYLNNYCRLIVKNDFFKFFKSLKLKNNKKKEILSMSKIYYQNIYNKYSHKPRLIKNLKSLTIDNSFKTSNNFSVNRLNYNSSYEKSSNINDYHVRTMTLSSNHFNKDKNKKNKFYNKWTFNKKTIKSNNKSYDNENNLFNAKTTEINKLFKKSVGKINKTQTHNHYSKNKKINETNIIKNVYSRKIIYNTKGIIKKPNKKNGTYINANTPKEQIQKKINNDSCSEIDKKKYVKKNNFIINLFLKNTENKKDKKIPKKIEILSNNKQKINSNNYYMFNTIDDFHKKNINNKIVNKNNEKNDEDSFNNFQNLDSVDLKNIFFFKFKNFCKDLKNNHKNKKYKKEINKVNSILSTTGASEDKYSLEKFYFIKNGHKLKKQRAKNENNLTDI